MQKLMGAILRMTLFDFYLKSIKLNYFGACFVLKFVAYSTSIFSLHIHNTEDIQGESNDHKIVTRSQGHGSVKPPMHACRRNAVCVLRLRYSACAENALFRNYKKLKLPETNFTYRK